MKPARTVILYNPISNEGHLDSWHVLFARLLLASGWRVVAMSPDPDGIAGKFEALGIRPGDDLRIARAGGALPSPNQRGLTDRIRAYWVERNARWDALQFQRVWRLRNADGVIARLLAWLHIRASSAAAGLVRVAHSGYRLARTRTSPAASAPSPQLLDPAGFRDQVNAEIAMCPGQAVVVLNMYIDAYCADPGIWREFSFTADIPWCALCITPSERLAQGYSSSPSCRGTLVLDEAIVARIATVTPGRHVVCLPDVADTSLPDRQSALAKDILRAAAGRRIVFMGGSIGRQKNLARWYELISLADRDKWFFVQIGRITRANLTQDDLAALDRIQRSAPDNLFIEPTYLADERSFNEIVALSAVIFAVYRDFFRSSNMLSKAAWFEKPILVASGCLMGERVAHYGIGIAVGQDDTLGMVRALSALESIPDLISSFQRYRDEISESHMQESLSDFLQRCIAT